jgi:hypothetical protein
MASQTGSTPDTKDVQELYNFLKSRIEILNQRIVELEKENYDLRAKLDSVNLRPRLAKPV